MNEPKNRWYHATVQRIFDERTKVDYDSQDFIARLQNESPNEEWRLRASLAKGSLGLETHDALTCYMCGNPVRLRGNTFGAGSKFNKTLHFSHARFFANCPYQNPEVHSKLEIDRRKYHGQREGHEHITLKKRIAECLDVEGTRSGNIVNVQVEQIIRTDIGSWRKPDINFSFRNIRIALEIQLATTYLDVILERHHFYRQQKIPMLWIFNRFSTDDEERAFAKTDVFIQNNENAYVFDLERYELSLIEGKLVLKCLYLEYYFDEGQDVIATKWHAKEISINDLTFDNHTSSLFYFDAKGSRTEAEKARNIFRDKIAKTQQQRMGLRQAIYSLENRKNKLMREYTRHLQAIVNNRQEAMTLIRQHRRKSSVLQVLCGPKADILAITKAIPLTEWLSLTDNSSATNPLEPNSTLVDLESAVTELEATCLRLENAKEKVIALPCAFVVGEMQLVDVGKMFPANFFRKNIDKVWTRHRLCPSPSRIGSDIQSLEYHLKDIDNDSIIYASRSDLMTIIEGHIKGYSRNLNEKKSERHEVSQKLRDSLLTRYRKDTQDLYCKIVSLGYIRRDIKRKRDETSLALKNCETQLLLRNGEM